MSEVCFASGCAGVSPVGLDAAGGVGGLLAVSDPDADADPNDPNDVDRRYVYAYDANGNVGQLVDLTPTTWDPNDPDAVMVARYEYEPFGRPALDIGDAAAVGPYGGENPFRFSTHHADDATGMLYAKNRYYWPDLGRWTTRDPIEESGGANLYGYVGNGVVGRFDPLGLIPNAPLGAVAALSHDRTQACCRYVETMTHGGVGGAAAHSHPFSKTHKCPPGLRSPRCCCDCGFRSVGIGFHHAKRVVEAKWGSCCSCRVQRRRQSGHPWSHTAIFVKCENGALLFMDHAGPNGQPAKGHVEDFGRMKDWAPESKVRKAWSRRYADYPVLQDSHCMSCDDLREFVDFAKSFDGWTYGLIQDCYWFGRSMMTHSRTLTESRDSCPKMP